MKTNGKKQGSKNPATSTNENMGHPGPPVQRFSELRLALDRLYDAAVTPLPFEEGRQTPFSDRENFLIETRAYWAALTEAYGFARRKSVTKSDVDWLPDHEEWEPYQPSSSVLAALHQPIQGNEAWWGASPALFLGAPQDAYLVWAKHWRGFPPHEGDSDSVEWQMKHQTPESWPVYSASVMRNIVVARRAALRLAKWGGNALSEHDSLALPRIEIVSGAIRSHTAHVEMAGASRDRKIQDQQRDLLLELAEMGDVDFKRASVRTKLIKAVPELDGLIITVDASTGNAWYRLDPRMKDRINPA